MNKIMTGLVSAGLLLGFAFGLPTKASAAVSIIVDGTPDTPITEDAFDETPNFNIGDCTSGCDITISGLTAIEENNYVVIDNSKVVGNTVNIVSNATQSKIKLTSDFNKKYGKVVLKVKEDAGEDAKNITLYTSNYLGFYVSNTRLGNIYNNGYSEFNSNLFFSAGEKNYSLDVNYMNDSLTFTIPFAYDKNAVLSGAGKIDIAGENGGIVSSSDSDFVIKAASTTDTRTYTIDLKDKTREQQNIISFDMATAGGKTSGKIILNKIALEPSINNGIVTVKYNALTNVPTSATTNSYKGYLWHTTCKFGASNCTGENALTFDPYLIVMYYNDNKVIGAKQFKITESGTKEGTINERDKAFSYSGIKIYDEAAGVGVKGATKMKMFISKGEYKVNSALPVLNYGVDSGFEYDMEGSAE